MGLAALVTPTTDKYALGYVPTYLRLAAEIGIAGRICEVGVQGGGSLDLWQVLFPLGVVVGVDGNPNSVWPAGTRRVVADQVDPGLVGMLAADAPFDLIVEDASHVGVASMTTFTNLWPLVAPGRWYVVEDWHVGIPGRLLTYDAGMLDTAHEFVTMLGEKRHDMEEILYRDGMIIIRKCA